MFFRGRTWIVALLVLLLAAATAWALTKKPLPPADFTFINETEIKSIDPALVNGQPELRVVMALFEGLVNWDPKTLAPTPGVAESWDISSDQLTYTFHIRPDAKWSDGSPLTAHDFVWQWQRVLDPLTVSLYSYQLYYLENAERYSQGDLSPGDRVEIELHEPAPGALPFARGKILHGSLVKIIDPPIANRRQKTTRQSLLSRGRWPTALLSIRPASQPQQLESSDHRRRRQDRTLQDCAFRFRPGRREGARRSHTASQTEIRHALFSLSHRLLSSVRH